MSHKSLKSVTYFYLITDITLIVMRSWVSMMLGTNVHMILGTMPLMIYGDFTFRFSPLKYGIALYILG